MDPNITYPNQQQHDDMMDLMRGFADTGRPQVGIFWYDYAHNTLFGVQKDDADRYIDEGIGTLHKLHKDYWMKQHYRAVAKGDKSSIFYGETNDTQIPRGRVFVRPDGSLYVTVGHWIDGNIGGQAVVDVEALRELLIDEFNLPEDFPFVVDEHGDLGHDRSGDKI